MEDKKIRYLNTKQFINGVVFQLLEKEGNKKVWVVMEKMINEYIKTHSNGKVSK